MMIANVLGRFPAVARRYDIIDPFQKTQWHSYGLRNVDRVIGDGTRYEYARRAPCRSRDGYDSSSRRNWANPGVSPLLCEGGQS